MFPRLRFQQHSGFHSEDLQPSLWDCSVLLTQDFILGHFQSCFSRKRSGVDTTLFITQPGSAMLVHAARLYNEINPAVHTELLTWTAMTFSRPRGTGAPTGWQTYWTL